MQCPLTKNNSVPVTLLFPSKDTELRVTVIFTFDIEKNNSGTKKKLSFFFKIRIFSRIFFSINYSTIIFTQHHIILIFFSPKKKNSYYFLYNDSFLPHAVGPSWFRGHCTVVGGCNRVAVTPDRFSATVLRASGKSPPWLLSPFRSTTDPPRLPRKNSKR